MKHLNIFTDKDRKRLINKRKGETKFGEHVQLIANLSSIYDSIHRLDVDYVIFGIAEDLGVYANHGKTGTCKAWNAVIKVLLNIQSNPHTRANRVCILGHLSYDDMMQTSDKTQETKQQLANARAAVESIDADVSHLVSIILKAGKIPIIIGGGHNNAYGNIKGSALAFNSPVNAVNFDAHSDFRAEEGRHSGNGFSYAYAEGFLKDYYILGLHENYTSNGLLNTLNKIKSVKYSTYEAIEIRKEISFKKALEEALKFVSKTKFGIELDCDAIEHVPSSAMTPSGFRIKQARQFIHTLGTHNNACYLHICEAAPKKKTQALVGKLISYLITDFIRASSQH